MDDLRVGQIFRRLRIRLRLSQADLAARAGVSQSTVSRMERGHLGALSLEAIRGVSAVLEIRVELLARWRGGDLDRLINARHSALHDLVATRLRGLPEWTMEPEVSFAIWGERGVVDILAYHPKRRMLLVIELKTELVDLNEVVGTFDRKVRLAVEIARRHGWTVPVDAGVAGWLIVRDTRTNRRRAQAHSAMLRAAFPTDGRTIGGWLGQPRRPIRCLSFWPDSRSGNVGRGSGAVRGRTRDAAKTPEA